MKVKLNSPVTTPPSITTATSTTAAAATTTTTNNNSRRRQVRRRLVYIVLGSCIAIVGLMQLSLPMRGTRALEVVRHLGDSSSLHNMEVADLGHHEVLQRGLEEKEIKTDFNDAITTKFVRGLTPIGTQEIEFLGSGAVHPAYDPLNDPSKSHSEKVLAVNKRLMGFRTYVSSLGPVEEAGRIYCMVPSIRTREKEEIWKRILRTWGPYCDVLKFVIDPPEIGKSQVDEEEQDFVDPKTGNRGQVVAINMHRKGGGKCISMRKNAKGEDILVPCKHIWEKVWRAWVWVAEHEIDKAEWFLKIDDDTYFIPEMFKFFLRERGWSWKDPHYFGHKLNQHGIHNSLVAGACAAFSKETLRRIAPVYARMEHEYGDRRNFAHGRCVDRDGATEEKTTMICLQSVNVTAEDSWDEQGRERVILFSAGDMLQKERKPSSTGWLFNRKPIYSGEQHTCCSPKAYAFHHYKLPVHMIRLHNLFRAKENHTLEELVADSSYMNGLRNHPRAIAREFVRDFSQPNFAKEQELRYYYHVRQVVQTVLQYGTNRTFPKTSMIGLSEIE